jgi:hypothetical protein
MLHMGSQVHAMHDPVASIDMVKLEVWKPEGRSKFQRFIICIKQ